MNGREKKNGYWRWINCGSSYHLQRYSSFSKQFENDEPVVVALLTVFLEVKSLHANKDCVDFSKSLLLLLLLSNCSCLVFFHAPKNDLGIMVFFVAAVAYRAGEPLSVEDIRVAPPNPGEVRVKITHTSICHTDLYFWLGQVYSLLKPPPKFRPNLDTNPAIEETS